MNYDRISSYPLSISCVDNNVFLTRGNTTIEIEGDGLFSILQIIFNKTLISPIKKIDLLRFFPEKERHEAELLIDKLIQKRFLYTINKDIKSLSQYETPEDLFYWHINNNKESIEKKAATKTILLIGINKTNLLIQKHLHHIGFNFIDILSDPNLNTIKEQDIKLNSNTNILKNKDKISFSKYFLSIASSEKNQIKDINFWNKFTLKHNIKFFPIIINHISASLGPYTIPYQTACYECFLSRKKSNNPYYNTSIAYNSSGFHVSMPYIISGYVSLFISKLITNENNDFINNILNINFINNNITSHYLLRIPRCGACLRNKDTEVQYG